jgi:hypothetical protein
MASTIAAFLLYQGHQVTLGETSSLTEIWMSCNIRPDLPVTYLPELGDNPSASNVIGAQSVVADGLALLTCKSITENEYIESNVRGTIYTVTYDNALDSSTVEPTSDGNTVILRISSSAATDVYSPGDDGKSVFTCYDEETATTHEFKQPISLIYAVTNIETTKRQRDKTTSEIIAMGQDAGKLNTATQWGVPAGCLLYTGISADPIQEITPTTKKITWNVTHKYSVKHLPGIADNTWEYINFRGSWQRVRRNGNVVDFYTKGTLPKDVN